MGIFGRACNSHTATASLANRPGRDEDRACRSQGTRGVRGGGCPALAQQQGTGSHSAKICIPGYATLLIYSCLNQALA